MTGSWTIVALASAGSAMQELLHWYGLRGKLSDEDLKLVRSGFYWAIVVLTIAGSGLGAWAWLSSHNVQASAWDCLLVGAAFPALFKTGVSAWPRGAKELGGGAQVAHPSLINQFWTYLGFPR